MPDVRSTPTTVVSCLFDLARREGTGRRGPDEYLLLAQPLLASRHGLVVFCDPELAPAVRDARAAASDAPTLVVERTLEDLAAHRFLGEIQACLDAGRRSPAATNPVKDTAGYFVLSWSKLPLLAEAAAHDAFRSARYWWADFGLAHVARPHPTLSFDDLLDAATDPLHVFMLWEVALDEVKHRGRWYAHNATPRVAAGLVGGDRDKVRALAEWFLLERERCRASGYVAHEEIVLGPVVAEYRPELTCSYGSYDSILDNLLEPRADPILLEKIVGFCREHGMERVADDLATELTR